MTHGGLEGPFSLLGGTIVGIAIGLVLTSLCKILQALLPIRFAWCPQDPADAHLQHSKTRVSQGVLGMERFVTALTADLVT